MTDLSQNRIKKAIRSNCSLQTCLIHDKTVETSVFIKYDKADADKEDYYLPVDPRSDQMEKLNGSELSCSIDVIRSLFRYESVLQK